MRTGSQKSISMRSLRAICSSTTTAFRRFDTDDEALIDGRDDVDDDGDGVAWIIVSVAE